MKPYMSSFIESAKKKLEYSIEEFSHGLSISVKPKKQINFYDIKKGNIQISEPEQIHSLEKTPNEFEELFSQSWLEVDDKLSLFTAAQMNNIFCISIKKNTTVEIENGIHGIFIIAKAHTHSTLNIISKQNAKIRMHILVQENAKITVNHIQEGSSLVIKKALVKNDGQIYFNDVLTTSSYARLYEYAKLCGKNSTAKQKIISLTYENAIADIYTLSDHANEYSFSDIITRSVIADSSKTLSRGLVKIQEMAANSEGYEKQDALMLSNECEADAIPNLEIHNHNVKCSHGSTVGRIDKEKLFYLMSRGLSEKNAQKEIIKAYFEPILDEFEDESLHNHIHTILEANL